MGIEIPRDRYTGEIDVKALFEIDVGTKETQGNETGKSNSVFPLIANLNTDKNIKLTDDATFQKNIREILEKKDELSEFSKSQKTEDQLKLK